MIQVLTNVVPKSVFQLPVQLIQERYYTPTSLKPGFVQTATLFEDLVVRCVRYAFQSIPSSVSRVFFDKWVALPFLRWRMLRHGYVRSPVYWKEERYGHVSLKFNPRTPQPPLMHGKSEWWCSGKRLTSCKRGARASVACGSNIGQRIVLISSSTTFMVWAECTPF